MNYIGSKKKLLPFIEETIKHITGYENFEGKVFTDLFAGTGVVGEHFKNLGCKVTSNDIQHYSYVMNKVKLCSGNNYNLGKLQTMVDELNALPTIYDGFIHKNYSGERTYFTPENAAKIDTIRIKIEQWWKENKIGYQEYLILINALLEASDKVANVASVYAAYLKNIKKSAKNELFLKLPKHILNDEIWNMSDNEVYTRKAEELVKCLNGGILYLDPPYNGRQYASNYHLLETISKYDSPKIHGKTGMRNYDDQKSVFSSRRKVKKAFEDLIMNANVDYIFLSYNFDGLMTPTDIEKIMNKKGSYWLKYKNYPRFMSQKNQSTSWTVEYLHYVEVKK